MTIGRLTPLQQPAPLDECLSINDVRILVAKHLGVDIELVTGETHFINDLGADYLDRIELVSAIEDQAGVEITDDDVEQIQVVGDLIRHLRNKKH
jgi:acyl carrier protein